MPLFSLIGDVLWIITLSIMAGGAKSAWGRMDADTQVPMQFSLDGKPTWRAKRNIALIAPPAVAFVIGVVLVFANRNAAADATQAIIFFGVRATVAAILGLAHLRWLTAALQVLEAEGRIKPLV